MLTFPVSTISNSPVSTISNSQVFLLKNVSSSCKCKSYIFSKNISVYAIFDDQRFNDMLTNDIVSFEQLVSEFCTRDSLQCYIV